MTRTTRCLLACAILALAAPAGAETAPKAKAKRAARKEVLSQPQIEFNTARAAFTYAVRACDPRQPRCDKELLKESEERYRKACGACTDRDACDTEVTAIHASGPTKTFQPCK